MDKEIHRVVIVGAGGMGGLFGSILSSGGLDVTLIDTNRRQIEAWANLYTEFALAVSARKDGIETPNDWLSYPKISEGVEGVKFIEASVRSNQEKAWAVI